MLKWFPSSACQELPSSEEQDDRGPLPLDLTAQQLRVKQRLDEAYRESHERHAIEVLGSQLHMSRMKHSWQPISATAEPSEAVRLFLAHLDGHENKRSEAWMTNVARNLSDLYKDPYSDPGIVVNNPDVKKASLSYQESFEVLEKRRIEYLHQQKVQKQLEMPYDKEVYGPRRPAEDHMTADGGQDARSNVLLQHNAAGNGRADIVLSSTPAHLPLRHEHIAHLSPPSSRPPPPPEDGDSPHPPPLSPHLQRVSGSKPLAQISGVYAGVGRERDRNRDSGARFVSPVSTSRTLYPSPRVSSPTLQHRSSPSRSPFPAFIMADPAGVNILILLRRSLMKACCRCLLQMLNVAWGLVLLC